MLAFVAPTFGLLWLDHARTIEKISSFIAEHWQLSPNWEEERKDGRSEESRLFIFTVAVTIVFLGPSIGGLIATVDYQAGVPFLFAWAGGAVLTLMFSLGWAIHTRDCWPVSKRDSGS